MYSGVIEGVGPRYCPSIEDKIHRFADKDSHQVFIEPEGLTTHELYPNGISTSLPFDVQLQIVRSIRGMENAHIVRPGYAIEYDYFDPRDLKYSLETKVIGGLFFAGQINGRFCFSICKKIGAKTSSQPMSCDNLRSCRILALASCHCPNLSGCSGIFRAT